MLLNSRNTVHFWEPLSREGKSALGDAAERSIHNHSLAEGRERSMLVLRLYQHSSMEPFRCCVSPNSDRAAFRGIVWKCDVQPVHLWEGFLL